MSSSDTSSVISHFPTPNEGFTTTTGGSISAAATSIPLNSVVGLSNGKVFVGIIEPGVVNNEQTFTGIVDTGGSQITNVVWTRGTNIGHAGGVTIVDYVTGTAIKMMTKGILVQHSQDGTHANITTTTISEKTPGSGMTVNGVLIKSNKIQTAGALDPTYMRNPCKFSVYRSAAWTTSNSFTLVQFDAKVFDTGANVDVVTNKGRFTAPVDGFYQFTASVNETTGSVTDMGITFYKNGSNYIQGGTSHPANANNALNVTALIQLAATDYVEVFYIGGSGSTGAAGASPYYTWFQGFLVSAT